MYVVRYGLISSWRACSAYIFVRAGKGGVYRVTLVGSVKTYHQGHGLPYNGGWDYFICLPIVVSSRPRRSQRDRYINKYCLSALTH